MPDSQSPRDLLAQLEQKVFATPPETAVIMRKDVRSIRRSIEAGEIPAVRVGPRWLVPVEWLKQQAGRQEIGA